ncbi:hypothetical protein [Aliiroseovarius sp. YM-037]|uniref:hypothetical protein n=1 Tax=Aliiroseovarius sp. YM-037 TaxID=3341728 RepID=UPI003A7F6626
MTNKALMHLTQIDYTWDQMNAIPEDHLAALSVLSYAVSEANALSRIYLCQAHEYTGEKAVDSATNIHRFLIIRTWSSRLFEAKDFFDSIGGKKPETEDNLLIELAGEALRKFDEIKNGDGYYVARDIRNEATNHYGFIAAKKNIPHVPSNMDCAMYIPEASGNCFYPLGEAVMFHARLNRRWKNVPSKDGRDRLFREWLDWNLAANRWLEECHGIFCNQLLFEPLGGAVARKEKYWVPPEMVGNPKERLTPVYLRDLEGHS